MDLIIDLTHDINDEKFCDFLDKLYEDEYLESYVKKVLEFEEIENAHDYHMTQSGENIFIYADIRVNKEMTVEEAHKLTDRISKKIRNNYRNIKRVLLHIEPVYD